VSAPGVRHRDPNRRHSRRVLGVPVAAARRLMGLAQRRGGTPLLHHLGIVPPLAVLGRCSQATSRQPCSIDPVAFAFIVGGFRILWAERREHRSGRTVDAMSWRDALKRHREAFALIPALRAAGATIIGGLLLACRRKAATEFSFFLAIPTLIAAGAYEMVSHRICQRADLERLAIGLAPSFFSALLAVRARAALHQHPRLRCVCLVPGSRSEWLLVTG